MCFQMSIESIFSHHVLEITEKFNIFFAFYAFPKYLDSFPGIFLTLLGHHSCHRLSSKSTHLVSDSAKCF